MSTVSGTEYDRTGRIISNLSESLSPEVFDTHDPNRWRAIPYEAEGLSGVMVGTGGGIAAPPIAIGLNAQGPHRIWLGVFGFISASRLRVRLSSDLCCQTLPPAPPVAHISLPVLHELMWRETELTPELTLILEGGHLPEHYPAALAYIRLEPVAEIKPAPRRELAHPMAITEDGFGIMHQLRHNRPQDLLEPLEQIPQDSCMRMLIWGAADGDSCLYPTAVGSYRGAPDHGLTRSSDDTYYANLRRWQEEGWDTMVTVRDYCRARKWEFHAYVRVGAFATQYPLTLTCGIWSKFFEENEHFCCRDREGRRVQRLSYAYPEVQEHMLAVFQEIVDYEPDGLCLAFIRGIPLILYEDIMIDGFTREHNLDPRELDELDQRWLTYQAQVITEFMSKVKALLKPTQRLSAIIPGAPADCARWGLDPASWMSRGIVDDLLPTGQKFTPEDVHVDDPHNLDFAYFRGLHRDEEARIIPMLYPWNLFTEDFHAWRNLIQGLLDEGADGFAVWDGNSSAERFAKISDIGLAPGKTKMEQRPQWRTRRLLTLDGYRFDRYHHFEVV